MATPSRGNPPATEPLGVPGQGGKKETQHGTVRERLLQGSWENTSSAAGWGLRSRRGRALSSEKVKARQAACGLGVCRSRGAASSSPVSHRPCCPSHRTLGPPPPKHPGAADSKRGCWAIKCGCWATKLLFPLFPVCFYARAAREPKKAQDLVKNTLGLQVTLFAP